MLQKSLQWTALASWRGGVKERGRLRFAASKLVCRWRLHAVSVGCLLRATCVRMCARMCMCVAGNVCSHVCAHVACVFICISSQHLCGVGMVRSLQRSCPSQLGLATHASSASIHVSYRQSVTAMAQAPFATWLGNTRVNRFDSLTAQIDRLDAKISEQARACS